MAFLTQGGSQVGSAQINDGAIVNADINAAAAIAYSKLNLAASIAPADVVVGMPQFTQVNLTASQIITLGSVPVQLIPAQGAGKVIVLESIVYSFTAGTQFTGGSNTLPVYGADTVGLAANLSATVITSASSSINQRTPTTTTVMTVGNNTAVNLTNTAATDFASGTGTLKVTVFWHVALV